MRSKLIGSFSRETLGAGGVFVGTQGAQLIYEGRSLPFDTVSADPAESRWSPARWLCAVTVAECPDLILQWRVVVVLNASLKQKTDSEETPPASLRLAVAVQVTEKARSTDFKATPHCRSCVYVHSVEVSAEQQRKRSRVGFPATCTSPGARTCVQGLSCCCTTNTPGSWAEALHATKPTSSTVHLRVPLNLKRLPSPAKNDESD